MILGCYHHDHYRRIPSIESLHGFAPEQYDDYREHWWRLLMQAARRSTGVNGQWLLNRLWIDVVRRCYRWLSWRATHTTCQSLMIRHSEPVDYPTKIIWMVPCSWRIEVITKRWMSMILEETHISPTTADLLRILNHEAPDLTYHETRLILHWLRRFIRKWISIFHIALYWRKSTSPWSQRYTLNTWAACLILCHCLYHAYCSWKLKWSAASEPRQAEHYIGYRIAYLCQRKPQLYSGQLYSIIQCSSMHGRHAQLGIFGLMVYRRLYKIFHINSALFSDCGAWWCMRRHRRIDEMIFHVDALFWNRHLLLWGASNNFAQRNFASDLIDKIS